MAADDVGLWVVCEESGAVVRIDPGTDRAGKEIAVGLEPRFVAVAFDSVRSRTTWTITRLDPATGEETQIDTEFGPR